MSDSLDKCSFEISTVESLITSLGATASATPYLTKYSLIRACGAIETAFKTLIADSCERRARKQIKRFLNRKVRESSSNPSYTNICSLLNEFDEDWKNNFKDQVKAKSNSEMLRTSLQSLVDARNEFAHGGNPNVSIRDVKQYFQDARVIVEEIDAVIG